MLEIIKRIGVVLVCTAGCVSMAMQQQSTPIRQRWLVTLAESKELSASPSLLPKKSRDNQNRALVLDVATENGPKVNVLSPTSNQVSNPITIHIQFLPKVTPVDWVSLKVHVQKWVFGAYHGNLDLTPRVREYLVADGVNMPGQDMPKGKYRLLLNIRDMSGAETEGIVVLDIQ